MSTDEVDLIFTGGGAEEAEDFIVAVKKRAYSKGKHKDNAWIAEYVSMCFTKKALRWYEKLDKETQNDWDLLKCAILDKYGEAELPSSMVPPSAAILPSSVLNTFAPAALPIKRGRIRVESECSLIRGYIASTFYCTDHCIVAPNRIEGAIFDFNASARTIKYYGMPDDYLMVQTYEPNWDLRKGSLHHAALMWNQGLSVIKKVGWPGDSKFDLWSIVDESRLVARWPLKDGGFWELEATGSFSGKQISLTPDYNGYVKLRQINSAPGGFASLTFHWEPLP